MRSNSYRAQRRSEQAAVRLVACRVEVVRRLARLGVISPALAEVEVRRMRSGAWQPLEAMDPHRFG